MSADGATIHLIRHGEPVRVGRMLGRTDVDVSAGGIAACVAQAADLSPAAIVTSDLVRARRCAGAIGADKRLPVACDPRWRELDFGEWDGALAADLDPAALTRFWSDPDAHPPPGGERWSALVRRVEAALAACDDGTLVVTHAGAMRAALTLAGRLSAAQGWVFALPYAALVTLRLHRGEDGFAQVVRLRP